MDDTSGDAMDYATLQVWSKVADARSWYVSRPDQLRTNMCGLLAELRKRWPRTHLGYSYKTNYLPAFIQVARDLGCWSEVVSRMEYDYARALGVDGDRILFNGPVKTADDLALAFNEGATVVVDSASELLCAVEVARSVDGPPVRIALRCELDESTPGTRFGIDLHSDEGANAADALLASDRARLVGLHAHHSGDRSAERYDRRTRELIAVHRDVFGFRPLEFLDVGGGLGSAMPPDLANQLPYSTPSYSEYAEVITEPLVETYGKAGPDLILEPGMGVLADTLSFVTQVARLKQTRGGSVAVVDGSMFNVKPLRSAVNLPVHVIRGGGDVAHGAWRLVGHTCMEIDVLHEGYTGEIAEGDYVVMPNLGAYTTVLNAPFIRPLPPVLTIDGTSVEVARPALGTPYLQLTHGATP